MTKRNANPEPGDLFAVTVPDGRYAVIRILKLEGKSLLIAVTPYLDVHLPTISDCQLLKILYQNRFRFRNEPALSWYEGKIPKDIHLIGNVPVTEQEKIMSCSTYSGAWNSSCAHPVYYEWRWIHDRERFEEEVKKRHEQREQAIIQRENVPKKMMEDEEFWMYISMLDFSKEDEEECVLPVVQSLSKQSVRMIKEFFETLAYKLFLLDTKEHAKQIGEFSYNEQDNYVSADGFLYTRCAAVAKGKEFYESALVNPINMPKDEEFEILLSVAGDAYTKRTGKDFEYETGCCYESFMNKKGWRIAD